LDSLKALDIAGVQFVELGEQHGGLKLGQRTDVVAPVQIEAGPLMDVRMPRQQGAAASRAEQFGAAETQDPNIAPSPGFAALDESTRSLGCVFDHAQAVGRGQGHDFPHGYDAAVKMRDNHGTGGWSNRVLKPARIQVPVLQMNIDEHGHGRDRVNAEAATA
jgi:hypothetical protein